jgi:hypothetical protein
MIIRGKSFADDALKWRDESFNYAVKGVASIAAGLVRFGFVWSLSFKSDYTSIFFLLYFVIFIFVKLSDIVVT